MIAGKAQFRCMTATATMSRVDVVSADLTQILLDLDAINGEVIGTTAAEKTDKIEATKLAIETAIEAANVDVPAGTVFADYPAKIATIGDTYIRPSFWPELPAIAVDVNGNPIEEVTYLLMAVYPDNQTSIEFYQISQNVTIDWGDGIAEDWTTTVNTIKHTYSDFNGLSGTINERGYKTAIITIRPKTSNVLNYIYILPTKQTSILEVSVSVSLASVTGQVLLFTDQPMLEIFNLVGKPKGFEYFGVARCAVQLCDKLRIMNFDTRNVTNARNIFMYSPILPDEIRLDAATRADYALYGTRDAKPISVVCPIASCNGDFLMKLSKVTGAEFNNMSNFSVLGEAFVNCYLLTRLLIPNTKVSLSCAGSKLGYPELKRIIENDLFPGVTSKTFTITGNPGAAAIMAAITAGTIVVPSGWTVIN